MPKLPVLMKSYCKHRRFFFYLIYISYLIYLHLSASVYMYRCCKTWSTTLKQLLVSELLSSQVSLNWHSAFSQEIPHPQAYWIVNMKLQVINQCYHFHHHKGHITGFFVVVFVFLTLKVGSFWSLDPEPWMFSLWEIK